MAVSLIVWSLSNTGNTPNPPPKTELYKVSGIIVDESSDLPLMDAKVLVGDLIDVSSNEDGFYWFLIKSGTHVLNISREDYKGVEETVTVNEEELTVNVSLELLNTNSNGPPKPPTTITGKIIESITGDPMMRVTVEIEGPSIKATVRTGADGVYVLNVYPGTYTLTADRQGYVALPVSVDASEEETYLIDMEMTAVPFIEIKANPDWIDTWVDLTTVIEAQVIRTDRTFASGVTVSFSYVCDGAVAKFEPQEEVADEHGRIKTVLTMLVEPLGIDIQTWDCYITASATVDGQAVENTIHVLVFQPCPACL